MAVWTRVVVDKTSDVDTGIYLTNSIQYCTRSPCLCEKARKRFKIHTYLKERNKIFFIYTWHNHLCAKSQRMYKKATWTDKLI